MASHMATDQSCLTSLTHSVEQWKRVLEEKASSAAELCHALDELRKYGALPTQVLQESKIGVAVNHLGKDVGMNGEVRKAAKALLADWKEMHRKRTRDPLPAETAPKCAKKVPETPEAVNQNLASAPKSRQRQKVLQMLEAALTGDEKNPASTALAVTIEEELHAQLEGSDKAYINQSRAIVFNLKDTSNDSFRQRLLGGSLDPRTLPHMNTQEMASDSKAALRAEMRQQSLQESAVKVPEERVTDAYTCERCGGKRCTYVMVTPTSCVNGEHSWTSVTCLLCDHRWKA